MSAKEVLRKCSVSSEGDVASTIAFEAKRIVQEAAKPVPAGETVKGQLRRSARALGYADGHWRVREAWYGHAESWSARAFEELRARYSAWKEKQDRSALAEAKKAATLLQALADGLDGDGNASLDRETIDRLRALAHRLGG